MSIFVPLAMQPFVDFGYGVKTVEVRNAKSPVAAQVRKAKPGDEVRLRWGYGPHGLSGIRQWTGRLGRVWEGPSDEIPNWVKEGACLSQASWSGKFFDPNGRLLCFEVLGAASPAVAVAPAWCCGSTEMVQVAPGARNYVHRTPCAKEAERCPPCHDTTRHDGGPCPSCPEAERRDA